MNKIDIKIPRMIWVVKEPLRSLYPNELFYDSNIGRFVDTNKDGINEGFIAYDMYIYFKEYFKTKGTMSLC